MKHSSLIIALIGVAAAASTAAVSAQSAVTPYGLIDMAVVRESGGSAGPATKLTSGVSVGSRLGFKETEDLGNGLSAMFVLENGFQGDTGTIGQGGVLFGRLAYIGLRGRFGLVLAGRQYTPEYLVVAFADPFGSGYVADSKNIVATSGNAFSRMDNTVKYLSPTFAGFTVELAAAPREVSGDSSAGRQVGGSIAYAAGPLQVRVGYHNRNNDTATVKNTENGRNAVVAAVYDFKVIKAHVLYGANRGLNSSVLRNTANPFGQATAPVASTDSRDMLVGLTVPSGLHTLLVSYIRKDDRTTLDQDANQIAIGYRYTLSKRTSVYAVHARIENRNGAGYTSGNASESGTGNRGTSVGISHAF
ncbi:MULTISPECIES: porin [unclassified Massilia]|uniref:porin n=1 Tax=unclassified Massilia TaxID=2609279 RepID=UPI00177D0A88|nr:MULTISPECIES: porin [unclassified Massilia]MBD8529378.1 porin [Massilia sp. CFBP 13647]MBD8672771.1 porin [Massilia sp. CFBP 13721]